MGGGVECMSKVDLLEQGHDRTSPWPSLKRRRHRDQNWVSFDKIRLDRRGTRDAVEMVALSIGLA